MLFDETGQAIYLFDKEKTPTPECYDRCAIAWPPVLTDGAPVARAKSEPICWARPHVPTGPCR